MESDSILGRWGATEVCEPRAHQTCIPSPAPGTGRFPPQTSAACGFNMIMLARSISKQLYTNSCGVDGEATRHPCHHRAQRGPSSVGASQTHNMLTATWPCWGPSVSLTTARSLQDPGSGHTILVLSGCQRPLSLFPWNFPYWPCQCLQEHIKENVSCPSRAVLWLSGGWESHCRVERPRHMAVPPVEPLGPGPPS